MGSSRIDQAVREYVHRYYDGQRSGERGKIDLVEWDAFIQEERLSDYCLPDGSLPTGRIGYETTTLVRAALRLAPRAPLTTVDDIKSVVSAVCRLQHRVTADSTAKADTLQRLQRKNYPLEAERARLEESLRRAMEGSPQSLLSSHLGNQLQYLDPHYRTDMHPMFREDAQPMHLESVAIPQRASSAHRTGLASDKKSATSLKLLGTLYVGDDRAGSATNDPETVRMASKRMPAQKFFVTAIGGADTVRLVLDISSVDWVAGLPDVVKPSRVFVVPSTYRGELPPTPAGMRTWAQERSLPQAPATAFHTFMPAQPGAHRLDLSLPAGEYRVIAEAGEKSRAEDARDNFTVKVYGQGLLRDTSRDVKTTPVEDFTTRVVKLVQCPDPAMPVEVVFAIDNSGSMSMARLVVAPHVASIQHTLRARGHKHIRFGSVLFSDWDTLSVHQSLRAVDNKADVEAFRATLLDVPNHGGNREPIGQGIHLAGTLFTPEAQVCRAVIVLSDLDALESFGWDGRPGNLFDRKEYSIRDAVDEARTRHIAVDIQVAVTGYAPAIKPSTGDPTASFIVSHVLPAQSRAYQGHTVETVEIQGTSFGGHNGQPVDAVLRVEYLDGHYSVSLWKHTIVTTHSPHLSVWEDRMRDDRMGFGTRKPNLADSHLKRMQWRRAFPSLEAAKRFLEDFVVTLPARGRY